MQSAREITMPIALATHYEPASPPPRVMVDDIGYRNYRYLHQHKACKTKGRGECLSKVMRHGINFPLHEPWLLSHP
jgi:hypothetical protein